ncbi:acyltransferase [Ferroacidibacillus organovorans]|nr:acyltransferase [Ferroacidibacillus organovorans]
MTEPHISMPYSVFGDGQLTYGDNVHISEHAWISLPRAGACLRVGDHTQIGRFFGVSCAERITIGHSCVIGERVFIADVGHAYEDPSRPILVSGLTDPMPVTIGDDVLIGVGSFIGPGVTIGTHVMIGANSVVLHDIPSYSVAAGNPARVIKRFDFSSGQWMRTGEV